MEPSDRELVVETQAGNPAAMGILLERHRAGMTAAAVRILGPGPDVEDVVHDAFLVALGSVGRLRDPDSAGAWLSGIARNLGRRRRRSVTRAQLGLATQSAAGPVSPSAEAAIDSLALRDWVWSALNRLSEPLRLAIVLRHFSEARSYREIALISGVPVGTVRSRLAEGRRKLAEALAMEADRSHADHRTVTATRSRFFREAFAGYNDGRADTYLAAMHESVEVRVGSETSRGRALAAYGLEQDIALGMKLHVTTVIASKRLTVLEGRFENPIDDPDHCPLTTTQIYVHDDGGGIRTIGLHYPQ
jgi:RNA polymerase sigma factor (sigma-70 family)